MKGLALLWIVSKFWEPQQKLASSWQSRVAVGNVSTRLTEHKRATKNGDRKNHIADRHRQTKHNIDWDSATCVTSSINYKQRLTLESCFTSLEPEPPNRSQQSLAPYRTLIQNLKQTAKQYTHSNNANDAYSQTVNLPTTTHMHYVTNQLHK